jgi:hypothetical protein
VSSKHAALQHCFECLEMTKAQVHCWQEVVECHGEARKKDMPQVWLMMVDTLSEVILDNRSFHKWWEDTMLNYSKSQPIRCVSVADRPYGG